MINAYKYQQVKSRRNAFGK